MKKLSILLAVIIFISCSGEKEKNEKIMLSVIANNKVLVKEQSKEMDEQSLYLKNQNDFIFKMKMAGATSNEIKKIENEKENKMNEFDSKLKDIALKMDKNHKTLDSISKLNK